MNRAFSHLSFCINPWLDPELFPVSQSSHFYFMTKSLSSGSRNLLFSDREVLNIVTCSHFLDWITITIFFKYERSFSNFPKFRKYTWTKAALKKQNIYLKTKWIKTKQNPKLHMFCSKLSSEKSKSNVSNILNKPRGSFAEGGKSLAANKEEKIPQPF